jgi:uncharacterized repeat protein (TIGR03803 family)
MGGANNHGVVLRLAQNGHPSEFSFDGTDGGDPDSGVVIDLSRHAIFGAMTQGAGGTYAGGIYTISAQGKESVLWTFCQLSGCTDGVDPGAAPLIEDQVGNFYGSTASGGTNNNGVVFQFTP